MRIIDSFGRLEEWWVIKIYCDCCKRKINDAEPKYSIEIKKGNDKEIILNFEKTKFNIDKKTKKVKKIITYDNDLHKIKEFLF